MLCKSILRESYYACSIASHQNVYGYMIYRNMAGRWRRVLQQLAAIKKRDIAGPLYKLYGLELMLLPAPLSTAGLSMHAHSRQVL